MINGKSFPTGVCRKELTKPEKSVKIVSSDNISQHSFKGKCVKRKIG